MRSRKCWRGQKRSRTLADRDRPAYGLYLLLAVAVAMMALYLSVQYEQARADRLQAQAAMAVARTAQAQALGLATVAALAVAALAGVLFVLALGVTRAMTELIAQRREVTRALMAPPRRAELPQSRREYWLAYEREKQEALDDKQS